MPPFNCEKYTKLQTEEILNRIKKYSGKLYLEIGGKLFDDYHAARVLPGFAVDAKLKILTTLKDQTEIVFIVSSKDLEKNKIRADSNLPYGLDCLRIIDNLRNLGLFVSSIVLTQYCGQKKADEFKQLLISKGETVYIHTLTKGYPDDLETIVSDEGYGANSFIKNTRPLVVITATGPGSGKLATCLCQLYHHLKRGEYAGYAKFETFPVWNLAIDNPINLAYEAATADIGDVNMLDSFHFNAYGINAINYNRDLDVFPVLKNILEKIYNNHNGLDYSFVDKQLTKSSVRKKDLSHERNELASFYQSPTDMGVNKVGFAIDDYDKCENAARKEIIRRYLKTKADYRKGLISKEVVQKLKDLMTQVNASVDEYEVVKKAKQKSEECGLPVVCIKLKDGNYIYGKEKKFLSATSSAVLNAIKYLANINDDVLLLPEDIFKSVIELKQKYFGHIVKDIKLTLKDTLIVLNIASLKNVTAKLAYDQLHKLSFTEAHSSCILSDEDDVMLKNLLVSITCEDKYEGNNLFLK